MRLVTAREMRQIDIKAQKRYGIPSIILMENAGFACTEQILGFAKRPLHEVSIFCGPGNNGGDGFVVARHLFSKGIRPRVFFFQKPLEMKSDSLTNFRIISKMKLDLVDCSGRIPWKTILRSLKRSDLIVDAIFGCGLSRDVKDPFKTLITRINHSLCPVVSVDVPSGLHADTGEVMGASIKAHLTVTFAAPKKGLYCGKGRHYSGKIIVADISIPRELLCRK